MGARALIKDKGFAAAVLLTLTVCIAANTAIFAIVNSVLLKPLPVPDAAAIVLMSNQYPKAGVGESRNSGAADYYDRMTAVTALQDQAMFNFASQTVDLQGTPERIRGMTATPSLFSLLRVSPALGRTFTPEEGEIGAEQKVILSDGLWRQLFGGDPSAVGKTLRLSGRPFTVVGVMPPNFNFVDPEVRLWVPLPFTAQQKNGRHSNNWYNVGRLKPGMKIEQVKTQVDALNAANMERFPQWKEILTNAGFHTSVEPLQDVLVKSVRGALYLLWGGALFVLVIGALNIANLALARLTLRRKELAVRLALGAGRIRLMRQLVVESVLVSLVSGVAGLGLGAALLRTLATIGLERLPRANEVQIDGVVVTVSFVLAAAAGLLIGLVPLADVLRINLSNALHDSGRTGTGGRRSRRMRQGLVTAQVGLAFVLLVGAGLLLASFRQLLQVDPGFKSEGVATASISAPRVRYAGEPELRTLLRRSLEAIRSLPGVTAAGATTSIPLGGSYSDSVILAEGYQMKPGESLISPHQTSVSPGYFEAMNIALVRGRYFDDRDNETAPGAIIVDEALARRFWPNSDPIGRRMFQPQDINNLMKTDENTVWRHVVGVVRSVRLEDLAGGGNTSGSYYFPMAQGASRSYTFALRTSADAPTLARSVRAEIAKIDPELALFDVRTMVERSELSLAPRKTSMLLALGFGALALFLCAVGIYGVLAYLVTQRSREIGIRMALGSTGGGIVKLILREGLILLGAGVILGGAGALALRKAVQSEVYGVQPLDPLVIGSVLAALVVIGLTACALPARRAAKVDPLIVLSEQ